MLRFGLNNVGGSTRTHTGVSLNVPVVEATTENAVQSGDEATITVAYPATVNDGDKLAVFILRISGARGISFGDYNYETGTNTPTAPSVYVPGLNALGIWASLPNSGAVTYPSGYTEASQAGTQTARTYIATDEIDGPVTTGTVAGTATSITTFTLLAVAHP